MKRVNTQKRQSDTQKIQQQLRKNLSIFNDFCTRNKLELSNYNLYSQEKSIIKCLGKKQYVFLSATSLRNTLYFFENKSLLDDSDSFYISIPAKFDARTALFEGYFDEYTKIFTITDILVLNEVVQSKDYLKRTSLINSLFTTDVKMALENVNCKLTIIPYCDAVSDVTTATSGTLTTESIIGFEKTIVSTHLSALNENIFTVTSCDISDVYWVRDTYTYGTLGILYVKTLEDSLKLHTLFSERTELNLNCTFNIHFNKWQVKEKCVL